jgi:uncharacterized protein DUF1844
MSEEKKPFTVTDRRHFTREGEVREDAPAPAPEPKAASRPAPPPEPVAQPARVITDPGRAPDPAHARAEASYRQVAGARGPEPDDAGGLDFVGLCLSLGTQASMMLGLSGRPGAPAGPVDLAGARSIISLLEILRDKTEGRRTAEEDEVLEGLLYELRMSYVAQARKGGP